MRIFLSWSGENSPSHNIAKALHKWLPRVIQEVDPWLSSHDMDSGISWGSEVDKQLADIHFGILAITRSSMIAPWLIFEAGAISKHIDRSFVCPYLFDMKATDLEGPLSKLQCREANRDGTLLLLQTINKALSFDRKLSNEVLKDQFEVWWPRLEQSLLTIKSQERTIRGTEQEKVRTDRDLLEEMLTLVRTMSNEKPTNIEALKNRWFEEIKSESKVLMDEIKNWKEALNENLSVSDRQHIQDEIIGFQELYDSNQRFLKEWIVQEPYRS